ncbi:basic proline-rich protein-like [Pogoniulus pusillus]|uniref:basic proline-rich protein-like n=1 Tax=Pogoniulus pusillus TaxID=488313 RepID=UPI0030B9908E
MALAVTSPLPHACPVQPLGCGSCTALCPVLSWPEGLRSGALRWAGTRCWAAPVPAAASRGRKQAGTWWCSGTSGACDRFQVTAAGRTLRTGGGSAPAPPALPLPSRGGCGPVSPTHGSPKRVPSGAGPRPRAALAEGLRFPRQTPPALRAPARPGDRLQPRAAPGGPARPSPSAAPARSPSPSSLPVLPHSRGHSGLRPHPQGPAAPDPFHRRLPQARARRSPGARRRSQLLRAREPQPQLGTGCRVPRPHSPRSGTALSHALLRCPGAGAARPRLRTALPVPAGSGGRSALQEGAESSYFLPKCQLLRRAASPGPPPASSSAAARAWGWHPSGSAPFRFLLQELGTTSAIEGGELPPAAVPAPRCDGAGGVTTVSRSGGSRVEEPSAAPGPTPHCNATWTPVSRNRGKKLPRAWPGTSAADSRAPSPDSSRIPPDRWPPLPGLAVTQSTTSWVKGHRALLSPPCHRSRLARGTFPIRPRLPGSAQPPAPRRRAGAAPAAEPRPGTGVWVRPCQGGCRSGRAWPGNWPRCAGERAPPSRDAPRPQDQDRERERDRPAQSPRPPGAAPLPQSLPAPTRREVTKHRKPFRRAGAGSGRAPSPGSGSGAAGAPGPTTPRRLRPRKVRPRCRPSTSPRLNTGPGPDSHSDPAPGPTCGRGGGGSAVPAVSALAPPPLCPLRPPPPGTAPSAPPPARPRRATGSG